MKVATAAAMRRIDQRTIETYQVPGIVLLENAGLELLHFLQAQWPDLSRHSVVIVAGSGNNGGDGFVLARHLWHRAVDVKVAMLTPAGRLRGEARRAFQMARAFEVPIHACTSPSAWRRFVPQLHNASLIVDALLGTGLGRPASGVYAEAIEDINASSGAVIAVDIPSGLPADDGTLIGPHIQATHTVTFALPKPSLVVYPAAAAVGTLTTADVGIPQAAIEAECLELSLLDAAGVAKLLPARRAEAHKGSHGHVLVVAGSRGKSGAGALSSQAALRSGAGLVTFALPEGLNDAMESRLLEVMTLPVAENAEGALAPEAVSTIFPFLDKVTALVLGPGIGVHPDTVSCVRALMENAAVPIVLDADGINCIAQDPELLRVCSAPVILTPHPGELSRLLNVSIADIQSHRLDIALEFARDYEVYVVLKGAGTVIYAPDGQRWINSTGNAAMATAGTGDVLAGLIGALLGQGVEPAQAAQCGVYLHGLAGDWVRDQQGASGLMASDLIDALPGRFELLRSVHG